MITNTLFEYGNTTLTITRNEYYIINWKLFGFEREQNCFVYFGEVKSET